MSAVSIIGKRVQLGMALSVGSGAVVDDNGLLQRVDVSFLTATASTGSARLDDRLRADSLLDTAHHATIDYVGRASSDVIGGVLCAKGERSGVTLRATNATLRADETLAFDLEGRIDHKDLGLLGLAPFIFGQTFWLTMQTIAHRA